MKDSFRNSKLDKSENINLSTISRIGLLGKVRKELIKEEIIKKIELTKKEQEDVIKSWCKANEIRNSNELDVWKRQNLQQDEHWEFFVTRELKWNKWCFDKFKKKLIFFFEEKRPYLDRYIYSIIRVKSEGLSKELYLRIKNNEASFYSIAKDYSEGIEKKTGGLVGPTNLINPHPVISNILKDSQKRQLWPPKRINDWWVIIRLEEKINATFNNELKIKLSKELGEIYLNNKLKESK